MRQTWTLLVLPILLFGQDEKASIWEARRKAYPDLVAAYDLAEIAPGPLRSLALVRISQTPGLADLKWKKELLAESFEAAQSATLPWKLGWVPQPNGPMPRLPKRLFTVTTNNQGLDRLGLQMHAVLDMLPLDRMAALEEFHRMPFPSVAPLGCTVGVVPHFTEYFTLATALTLPAESLQGILSRVDSPLHIAGAAKMISSAKVSAEDRAALATTLAQRLESISGDDRAFSDSTVGDGEAVLGLGSLGYETVVWKAWRTYQNIRPIEPDEMKPGKVDVGVEDELFPPLTMTALAAQLQWVELGNQKVENAALTAKVDALLKEIDDRKPENGQDSLDLVWAKCKSLGALASTLLPGTNRDRITSRYVSLLAISNLPAERLPEWYEAVVSIAHLSRSIQSGDSYISTAMEQSGNPLVSLVGRLQRMH